jgi:NAD(P)H-hydrate repair Nnr-like enzyme with NAD(P)H-hydrate dehydratase domain
VRYVGTPTAEALVRAQVPEVVHGPGRVQAWVVGPGLDVGSRAKGAKAQLDVAREALASDLPVLVDAGGLDLVTGTREAPTLLTPHAGEAARLLTRLGGQEVPRTEVEGDPVGAARRLGELTGATILLKGSTTVVVAPGAVTHVQSGAPAWLATAGAGDVLAGVVGTLLASGLAPDVAGALGALVHGEAAHDANPGGPVRALAVAQELGRTIAHLLAASRG